ncbi:ORF_36 [Adoxophyes orana granulovirus]|uniref:ORF_36 n=1 Tax=Adoxophyes orana granulovirus TaxID=170617 RepID=Q7T9X9_GVAO|nr:ORF_36 [Adoxophyes orana granulovirus]AAP85673.1 ORF_36 [Adoxophyes orana granulovirus]
MINTNDYTVPPNNITNNSVYEIDMYRAAAESYRRDYNILMQEKTNLLNEKSSWQLLEKQLNEVIAVLSDQIRKNDNDIQNLEKYKTDCFSAQKQMVEQSKIIINSQKEMLENEKNIKMLKKKIKRLRAHINKSNDTLDDIINNGDALLDQCNI